MMYKRYSKIEESLNVSDSDDSNSSIIKPKYYKSSNATIDVIDFCMALDIPFSEGNIIKYVVRHRKKGGIDDLRKAVEYINRIVKAIYGKEIIKS